MVFLFIHRYFESVLPARYYQHLKLLAFAMALSESVVLSHHTIHTIECLLNEFDRLFPSLYSVSTSIKEHRHA